ncbi:hypothetical protein A2U01_0111805, partial [Trifolium medium]|nr:hypothetical protein [Trifolium medium]
CAVKRRHNSVQESIDPGDKLLYQIIAPFRSVVGNSLHLIDPRTFLYSRMASMFSMWSTGSVEPS